MREDATDDLAEGVEGWKKGERSIRGIDEGVGEGGGGGIVWSLFGFWGFFGALCGDGSVLWIGRRCCGGREYMYGLR